MVGRVESDNIHYINIRPGEITERLWKTFRQVKPPRRRAFSSARTQPHHTTQHIIHNTQGLGEEVVGEQALNDLRRIFKASARLLGNYKPVLGSAFHDYIGTHP
jgi:hypothetical protein